MIGYDKGEMVIHPKYAGAPESKTIVALRLFVNPLSKPMGGKFWDVTGQHLIAQIEPLLIATPKGSLWLTLTAHGSGPSKRYTVDVRARPVA